MPGLRVPLPRLRDARAVRGRTIEQLAREAGVTTSTVSRLENGLQGAYMSTVVKLARALEVTPGMLQGAERLPWERGDRAREVEAHDTDHAVA
jgi:transcriptional regulator with XRE-family HTH domain